MKLRDFQFEIKGTVDEEDEEKAKGMLESALRWIVKVEEIKLFPVYN